MYSYSTCFYNPGNCSLWPYKVSFTAMRLDLNPVLFDIRSQAVGTCTEAGTQAGPTLTHEAPALQTRLLLEAGPGSWDPPQRILGGVVFFRSRFRQVHRP